MYSPLPRYSTVHRCCRTVRLYWPRTNFGTDLMSKSTVMFKMFYGIVLSLFAALPAPVAVAAEILSDAAIMDAATADLEAETALFRTIQQGDRKSTRLNSSHSSI